MIVYTEKKKKKNVFLWGHYHPQCPSESEYYYDRCGIFFLKVSTFQTDSGKYTSGIGS